MRHAIAAVLLVVLAAPAWAGWDEGVAAYDRGDYATAYREWKPLAEQGHSVAQYNLGSLYYHAEQDYENATKWLRKAAQHALYRLALAAHICIKHRRCSVGRRFVLSST